MALFANGDQPRSAYEAEAAKVVSLIGKGAVCEGGFRAADSTRVDGEIQGDTIIEGTLIVGPEGKITGNVRASNVFAAGSITGNVDASEGRIEISDTGRIIGDIVTRSIVIDENAVFRGNCNMIEPGTPA